MRTVSALALGALCAAAAHGEPITITDHENREITLEAPAGRIASIPIPMASTLIAIDGGTSKLVGMNPTAKSAILEGILGRIFPEARDIPSDITGPNFIPNVEELAATDPDLVIQWAGRGGDYVDPITNAGLATMLISYGTEAKAREYMTMAATAMGKPGRIAELIDWRAEVAAGMAAKADRIAEADRPKVLYLLRAQETLRAAGAEGNYNAWYIDLAGGRVASAGLPAGWADVNAEQVAEWNPDVILLNSFEAGLGLERITEDPILSLTNAAQSGRVYKMPLGGYRWDPPNQESPLTWMWLARLLHPEVFDYDLRAEMKSAYRRLYGHDLTEAEIDGILRMDTQGRQAGYNVFAAK
jgi:iron complex transport system substrate-binding protein